MTARVAFSSFPPKLIVLSVLGLTQKQKCCHAAFHLVLLNAQHLLHAKNENPEGPDMMRPRGRGFSGVGAGAGPKSANGKNILCVFKSRAMVLAPGAVFTVSSTLYLSGDSWRITVTVLSPLELNTRRVSGLKHTTANKRIRSSCFKWSLSLSGNLICGFDTAIRKAGNIVHLPARLRRFPPPLTGMKTCLFCIDSNRVARDWNDHTHLT